MKCYYKQLEVGYFSSFTSSLKIYNIRSSEVSNIGIWRTKSSVMSSASVQFAVLKFLIILILMWKHVIWHQQCDGLQRIFNVQWNVTRMNLTKAVRKLSLEQIKWKSFIHSVKEKSHLRVILVQKCLWYIKWFKLLNLNWKQWWNSKHKNINLWYTWWKFFKQIFLLF